MNFEKAKIADLISEISMGPFGSNIKVECFVEKGIPVLNGSNLDGFVLKEDSFRYVTEEKADSLGKANAHRGDVIITHRGTLGQIVFIPRDSLYDRYVISQSQFRVKCNEKILPEYLVYYFHTRVGQHKLLSNTSQVGVPALARATTTFQTIEIEVPDLDSQRKIIGFLEAIRSKIEVNNKINKTLEEQAKAIYSDIFISHSDPTWPHGHLSDLITIRYGKDHTNLYEGPFPVYGSGGLIRYVERPLYDRESVLIPRKGTLNNVIYVNEPFWSVDTMFFTEMKQPNVAKFVFYFLKSQNLASFNAGSAVPSMTTKILNSMELVLPNMQTFSRFENIVDPMFSAIQKNNQETRKLGELRDLFLPRLMSGNPSMSSLDI
ncbi:MAG: restriction endonuclease subunit S [Thermoguttaceae bacterium]|nr:restriction endonuclease subunit S [Thermoguttaceae bacterium]